MESLDQSLKEYGAEFRQNLEANFDIFLLISEDTTVLDFNSKQKESYVSEDKVIHQKLSNHLPLDVRDGMLKKISCVLEEKVPQFFEYSLLIGGKFHHYDAFFLFLKVNRILILIREINERKQLEIDLEKERNTLNMIIEKNPYAIGVFNHEGYFVKANQAYKELYQSTPPQGYSIFKDPIMEKMGFLPKGEEILRKSESLFIPETWYNPRKIDPSRPDIEICLRTSLFPIMNPDNSLDYVVMMYEDITKTKMAERKLRESEKMLKTLKKELEIRVKERTYRLETSERKFQKAYKRANCYKGLFTHDISNIFQVLSNALELSMIQLHGGENLEEINDLLNKMQDQVNRGKRLVMNITNLSEIEKSEMPIVPISVRKTIEKAIPFAKNNFQNRLVHIDIDFTQDYRVKANELLLDVFENILINAIRYNKSPEVEIKINCSKVTENDIRYIKMEFIDNGFGISDERKEKIFQKSLKNIREGKGLGLGLSLVREILDLYAGKIWVENRIKDDYKKGSKFIILIPEAMAD